MSYPSNSTYYVACYNSIEVGQLVEEGVTLGPVRVHYEPGIYSHVVKAEKEQSGDYCLHTESRKSTDYSDGSDEYQLIVRNATDRPWYFAMYQACPGSTSVAWQVCSLPPSLGTPTTHHIRWRMNFGTCIAEFNSHEQKYTSVQYAPAILNHSYEVVSLDGITSISTAAVASGKRDHLLVKNKTDTPGTPLSLGFIQSVNIVAIINGVSSNQEAVYGLQPTYHIACYHSIGLGQLVDEGIAMGPVEVKYDTGVRTLTTEMLKDCTENYRLQLK